MTTTHIHGPDLLRLSGLILALLLSLGACDAAGGDTPSTSSDPQEPAPPQGKQGVELLGLRSQVPAAWQQQTPSSGMRLLQFLVPDPTHGNAEFVVYYFGPGQGGSAAANIARWRSQFSADDGSLIDPVVSQPDDSALPLTLVSLTGNYARGVGMGAASAAPDQTLLAAIIETSEGNVFAQLHGPSTAVRAAQPAFHAFATGLTPPP